MNIELLDPGSYDGGQPHEQFRWLREHHPVYRHPEPDGGPAWVPKPWPSRLASRAQELSGPESPERIERLFSVNEELPTLLAST